MVKRFTEEPRLTHLTEIALALPDATRKVCGSHAQFLVRKKPFAYFLDDHHGDGIVAVACKVVPRDNKTLAEVQPGRFYLPAYIASKGWVALRLDVGKIDWAEVKELLRGSYVLIAPQRLVERLKTEVPNGRQSAVSVKPRGHSQALSCSPAMPTSVRDPSVPRGRVSRRAHPFCEGGSTRGRVS